MKKINLFSLALTSILIVNSTQILASDFMFENYPAKTIYKGTPVKVDFTSSKGSKRFVTRYTNGAAKGPNFAGGFTIVSWGCGTSCEVISVISATTGKIYEAPLSCGDHQFKISSNLLIINPPGEYPEGCTTEYYLWNGKSFDPLKKNS